MAKVVVGAGPVVVRQRERVPRVHLNVLIPAELARRLRIFAVERDFLVQDLIEGSVRALVDAPRRRGGRAA